MKPMNIKAILGLALLAGGLASCSVEEQEIPASELYAREFYKKFGVFDKNQDWSVVEQKSITVSCVAPTHVKVYEEQDGEYRLAADYKNVTNGQTITFEGMKGDDDNFLVSLNDLFVSAKNGETVTAMQASEKTGVERTSGSGTLYSQFIEEVNARNISVESTGLLNNLKDAEDNTGKAMFHIPEYFLTKSQSPYNTFYPVYWNSEKKHTVGVYYHDPQNGRTKFIPIYTDHEGDEVKYYDSTNSEWVAAGNTKQSTDLGEGKTWDYTKGIQSKGYKIKLTDNVVYGIYVEVEGKKYFSQKNLNDDGKEHFATVSYTGSDESGTKITKSYILFDDPDNDNDFNDLVICTFDELKPISDESVGWTVACEDLGGTFDFDFNDLVFRVYHTSGYEYADIVPLAAGGTLPAWLWRKTTTKDAPISEEWHSHFGKTANDYSSSQMINTFSITEPVSHTIRIGTGTTFSMKEFSSNSEDDGGIYIKVKQADGEITSILGPNSKTDVTRTPQMLILPLKWYWPTELVDIRNVYTGSGNIPSFADWAKNVKKNQTWVNYHNEKAQYINEMIPRDNDNPYVPTDFPVSE